MVDQVAALLMLHTMVEGGTRWVLSPSRIEHPCTTTTFIAIANTRATTTFSAYAQPPSLPPQSQLPAGSPAPECHHRHRHRQQHCRSDRTITTVMTVAMNQQYYCRHRCHRRRQHTICTDTWATTITATTWSATPSSSPVPWSSLCQVAAAMRHRCWRRCCL